MAAPGRIKDLWREQRLFEQRAIAAVVVVGLLAAALVARLVWLQVTRYEHFTDLAQGNRVRTEPLPAPRGMIYDRAGVVLAENLPAYQLELVREQVPDLEGTLAGLVRRLLASWAPQVAALAAAAAVVAASHRITKWCVMFWRHIEGDLTPRGGGHYFSV